MLLICGCLTCSSPRSQDRYYVKHHALPPLHDAGMRLFKSVVYDHVKRDATKAIIVLLEREREGEVVDRGRIRACVEVRHVCTLGCSLASSNSRAHVATTADFRGCGLLSAELPGGL